jgi:hypothetical protein
MENGQCCLAEGSIDIVGSRSRSPIVRTIACAPSIPHPASGPSDVLIDPGNGPKPFVLLPSEKLFLKHAFKTGTDSRLLSAPSLVLPTRAGRPDFFLRRGGASGINRKTDASRSLRPIRSAIGFTKRSTWFATRLKGGLVK